MIYTYRKLLLAFCIVIFLIVGGIITYNLLQPKNDTPKKTASTSSQTLKGLDNTKAFPLSETTKTIVQSYITTTMTAKHQGSHYTATVRNGSYHQTVTPDGSSVVSVLIDVLPFKETYYFYRATNSSQLDIAVIRCAPEAQQLVHPSTCKDLSND